MHDLVQPRMDKTNWIERLKQHIDTSKFRKENPVIPATRMPGDLQKIFREARKGVRCL
jgi:hypothetical protein